MNRNHRAALRALWTALLLWFVHAPLFAEQFGVLTYVVNSDNTVTVTGCPEDTVGPITIPAEINGRRVTAVRGFWNRRGLTSVSIPEGVTTIESFSFCIGLTSISIPASVTSLVESPNGDFTFDHCRNLTAIEVSPLNPNYSSLDGVLFDKNRTTLLQCPAGKSGAFAIPGNVTSIRIFAFRECGSLTSVSIPGSVTSIGPGAFTDCASLTSVSLAASVTSIAENTFWRCTSLTSISLPAGVNAIKGGAFSACTSLTSVSLPASVATIDASAFYECPSMTAMEVDPKNPNFSNVDGVLMDKNRTRLVHFPAARAGAWSIPASVSEIPLGGFLNCTGLTSVIIPTTITSIPHNAFEGCTGLASIVIPEGVTSIGSRAFASCSRLASVTIPDGVTVIWASAFQNCTSLTSVVLGSGLSETGVAAFAGCTSLTSVALGATVARINRSSFEGCTGLVSLAIPGSVTFLESSAFAGCTSLATVVIPDSVTLIDHYAFTGCTGLASVTIGSGVTFIGWNAFEGCTSLTSVAIPDSVTVIGDRAFLDCSGLASVSIGSGVIEIGWFAFENCTALTSVTIPPNVTKMDVDPFPGCTGLTAIEVSPQNPIFSSFDGVLFDKDGTRLIKYPPQRGGSSYQVPTGVVDMGGAFADCPKLTSVAIPVSVTSVGTGSFPGCQALNRIDVDPANPAFSSVDGVLFNKARTKLLRYPPGKSGHYSIPGSVAVIGEWSFSNCPDLTSVSILGGVTTISQSSFIGCTGLTSVALPNTLTTIGQQAFEDCTGLTSVSIPNSVTRIDYAALRRCTGLTSVAIGRGVSEIMNEVFLGCTGLTQFTVDALNSKYRSIDGVLFSKSPFELLRFPARKAGHYSIPNGVTSMNGDAFDGCSALTSVFIPASVAGILSFQDCSQLTTINVDPQNQSYSSLDGVLYDKVGITLLRYPPGRTGNCTVPARVTNIAQDAFEGCTGLQSSLFLGDSPWQGAIFADTAPGFTVYYFRGSLGFTSPPWPDYPLVMIDRSVHPAAEWLLSHGLPYNADLQDDPNGDGVILLMAYALGLDPSLNLRGSLPVPILDPQSLRISFHGISPGITYTAETSIDLVHWTAEGVILSAPGADGHRTASIGRDGPVRYLRLAVAD